MIRTLVLSLMLAGSPLQASSLADPTRPVMGGGHSAASASGRQLQLNATYIGKQQRYAVINGVKLREGERYGALTLRRIQHQSVVLTAGDRTVSLQLNNLKVKTQ